MNMAGEVDAFFHCHRTEHLDDLINQIWQSDVVAVDFQATRFDF
jgi:hypothetical protein